MTRDTGEHEGEGRGWRGNQPTPEARRCLNAMRNGQEWASVDVARAAGLSHANTINLLKRLERDRYVTSRLESVAQHKARDKDPGNRFKGPRRQYWRITATGKTAANA